MAWISLPFPAWVLEVQRAHSSHSGLLSWNSALPRSNQAFTPGTWPTRVIALQSCPASRDFLNHCPQEACKLQGMLQKRGKNSQQPNNKKKPAASFDSRAEEAKIKGKSRCQSLLECSEMPEQAPGQQPCNHNRTTTAVLRVSPATAFHLLNAAASLVHATSPHAEELRQESPHRFS